ncbi:hypothetical protein DH2020_032849 [Rehmannia glutinosa]|uniref:Uncharacterized protein n=1 Tax=Rehmannia glutinosa TaxID=99300 RepID=A0ABR0VDW9_REHGL
MGLRSKHLLGDHHQLALIDWAQTSGTAELPKPPFTRRQQPPHHQLSEPLNCPRFLQEALDQRRHPPERSRRRRPQNKRPKTSAAAAAEPRQQHCRNIPYPDLMVSSSSINSSLDVNTSLINNNINPTSYQSLNDGIIDYYQSVEESTITSLDIPANSSLPAWPVLDTSTSAVNHVSNYWNWNEIDLLASSSADDLNYIAWDDVDIAQIKP